NPLSSTHKFLQACSACFLRKAPGTYAFVHKPDLVHKCKQDVLLCKRKGDLQSEWAKVRPLPQMPSFNGPFVLCKDMMRTGNSSQCKFGENCTFAYNQLEIDVWTMERTGKLDRNLLFETTATKLDPVNRITCLLQEYQALHLCHPPLLSLSLELLSLSSSSLPIRCLAFEAKGLGVSKVRLFNFLCRLDLCAQSSHLHSQREDGCNYAHSVIELRIWMVQHHTETSNFPSVFPPEQLSPGGGAVKPKGWEGSGGARYGLSVNLKMEFACAQCWQAGLKSFPDRALKYCCGRARHPWTKDRSVLLVTSLERKKPVQIRPLPHAKHVPNHYEICIQVLKNKKCNYPGNCTFAHSPEEREMWMYMKNNDYNMDQMYDMWLSQSAHSRQSDEAVLTKRTLEEKKTVMPTDDAESLVFACALLDNMDQMYDMWLSQSAHSRQSDEAVLTKRTLEEKKTVMPTDDAESLIGFYCHLCGRHSNGERQWHQHISSERHKDRVFSCEGEEKALTWNYRFPGTCFRLCPKLDDGCSDGVSCDYAHSPEELQEMGGKTGFPA
ncbi:unnamed protein product, partial [Tetraodon nigroviridis]